MRVVVTGAGGYVGGRLVDHLRATGVDVVPTLRTPRPWRPDAVVTELRADALAPLLEGADAVVHLAGAPAAAFGTDPEGAHAATVEVARQVAVATRAAEGPRLVHLSTFHVYGDAARGVVDEDVVPAPVGGYGASRVEAERAVAEHGPERTVSLRLTNALGPPTDPRIDPPLVAHAFCRTAAEGGALRPADGGRALRDFVDLAEACRVVAAAADGDLPAGVYDLGSGCTRSVLDLALLVADLAEEVLGRRPEVAPAPAAGPEPVPFRVALDRLRAHVRPPDDAIDAAVADTLRLLTSRPG